MDPEATLQFFIYSGPVLLVAIAIMLSFIAGFVVGYFYSKSESFWKELAKAVRSRIG